MALTYIFGYGSLMNPTSIARTIDRPVAPAEIIPVYLANYRRVWQLGEQVRADALNRLITAVFLDITPVAGALTNGILFGVDQREFSDLLLREKNYEAVNVTQQIRSCPDTAALPLGCEIVTFVSKPAFQIVANAAQVFVMERYLTLVEDGCRTYGDAFLADYRRLTPAPPFPTLPGTYQFVDAAQQKNV